MVFLVAYVCTSRITRSAKLINSHLERIDSLRKLVIGKNDTARNDGEIFTFSRRDRGRSKDFKNKRGRRWEIEVYFLIWIRKCKGASRWYRRRYLIALKAILYLYFFYVTSPNHISHGSNYPP